MKVRVYNENNLELDFTSNIEIIFKLNIRHDRIYFKIKL